MKGLEFALCLGLGAFVALGLSALRRPGLGPTPYWVAGWVSAGLAGLLVIEAPGLPTFGLVVFPLGTLFPWLLLAGSLEMTGRRVPGWLLPGALVYGLARAVVVAGGRPDVAYAAELAVAPAVTLWAGWLAHRSVSHSSLSARLLGPSFVVLTLAGCLHIVWLWAGFAPAPLLTSLWMIMGPPVLGIQIYVVSERTRRLLAREREVLEQRVRDRTRELAEVADALRRSEDRYRSVSELSSDYSFGLVFDADLNLTLEWITGAFERITGSDPDVLTGQGWWEFVAAEQRAPLSELLRRASPGGRVFREIPIVAGDGSARWLELRARTEPGGAPGALRVVGACRDVTETHRLERERRKLERQMYASERLESLGRLSGGIAHDFNNLLSVILGNAALAEGEPLEEAPWRARLERIRAAGEHAARLTDQMLAYAGKARTVRSVLDASNAVEDLLELVAAALPEKCTFAVDLTPGLWIEADEVQVQQVVMNLVTNAAEALDEGRGSVELRTHALSELPSDLEGGAGTPDPQPGPYAVIEVRDSGRGMDARTQKKAFEPFFSTKFTGRGMGLASVLGIVRAHGGSIGLESIPAGGTAVRVFLPRVAAPAAQPAPVVVEGDVAEGCPHVLVVDDDEDVLEVAVEFLRREGFRVSAATGGRAALVQVRAESDAFDVVVLDLSMPDVSGEETFHELRAIRPDLAIVLVTGFNEELASRRFRASRASGFLRKPFTSGQLAASVRAALANPVEKRP